MESPNPNPNPPAHLQVRNRELWAQLRETCSLADVADMLCQDVQASDMPDLVVRSLVKYADLFFHVASANKV